MIKKIKIERNNFFFITAEFSLPQIEIQQAKTNYAGLGILKQFYKKQDYFFCYSYAPREPSADIHK